MLMMALRLSGPQGHPPAGIVSTTPKPLNLLKQIMAAPSTVITRAKTSDNASNLDASTLAYLRDKYGGTRLGRQELDAELLSDIEGALWRRDMIDAARIGPYAWPDLQRVIVGVDPPGGSARGSAEAGIIVAGVLNRHFFVLCDASSRASPEKWAADAVCCYREFSADRIVAERNFGGDMVESTI